MRGRFKPMYVSGMKLLVTLEPDETGMIVAECPAIPGCVPQGPTEAEVLENIREAIAGCPEVRLANGMPLTIQVREVEVHTGHHLMRARNPNRKEALAADKRR